jgi:hypothetical protein
MSGARLVGQGLLFVLIADVLVADEVRYSAGARSQGA